MPIELPRHVKKPGGLWKRVENQAELDAALADGWLLRLPVAAPAEQSPAEPHAEMPESPEPEPEPESEDDELADDADADIAEVSEHSAPKRRGGGKKK